VREIRRAAGFIPAGVNPAARGKSAMSDALTVLYEDNHCLAVAKPAPLLTQAPPGVPSLEAMARAYLKDRYHKAGRVYLGIPHRLDRPVSGVVLFARSSKAARRLAEQFRARSVRKVYWALVEGDVRPDEGHWEDWLLKVPDEARTLVVPPDTPAARQAVSRYRRLEGAGGGTLLEVEPQTGRMHQIRVQAASRGWPVRGDVLYGSRLPFGPVPPEAAAESRQRVIALHARSLAFRHPIRYEPLTITAPLPETWCEALAACGLSLKLD
jgi:23S rRNA pseudouridine1911/1915/1917 synthase